MSMDDRKRIDLSGVFPANSWPDQEHLLLTGEPIQITNAKRFSRAFLEAMTGPFMAAPLAFISAGLLGLFNHSDVHAMDINHLPDQHSPRFQDTGDLTHFQNISGSQEIQKIQAADCPLGIFWIDGASPPTQVPIYYPASIPCDINYSGRTPTLTFTGLDFEKYGIEKDKNAVLITPIAALTEDGKIPLLVDVQISDKVTNAASMLCPSDFASNLMFGNPAEGNGFANGPEATADCYSATETVVAATAFDNQGKPHPLNLTIDGDGSMFIFANTKLTDSGILQIQIGDDVNWPSFVQSSLMTGLKKRFGEGVVVLFAPNGVDPVAERFPELAQSTPIPSIATATALPPSNAESQPPAQLETTSTNEALPRQFFGQNLSVQLTCLDGSCPDVYGIVDETLPAFQNLMQLYASGSILDEKQSGKLVAKIISSSKEPKIKNFMLNLIGKDAISTPVKKFDKNGISIELSDVLFISQDQTNTSMLATLNLNGKTLYFVINAESKLLNNFSFQLTDEKNHNDSAGLQVFENIQADVIKPDSPSDSSTDWDQDLFLTKPDLVTGLESGKNILFKAKAFKNEAIGCYQVTKEGLIPATINLATIGKYVGVLYKNPIDKKLYVQFKAIDETGRITGTFLVPIEYFDTSN